MSNEPSSAWDSGSIRLAGTDDEAALLLLLESQYREHDIALSGEPLAAAVRGMLADPSRGRILVAMDAGATVGIAVLSFIWALEHGGHSAWLDELYVAPDRRGRGVGRALLLRAIDEARGLGCAAVDLEVERSHRRAERLYGREGFRRHSRSRWVLALR
jgi:GNAT superfamily N-acetyltransferase